jgi:hypothetical protein
VLAEPDEASGAFPSDHRGLLVRMVYDQSRVTPTR